MQRDLLNLTRSILLGFMILSLGACAQVGQADELPDYVTATYGHPPEITHGSLPHDLQAALQTVVGHSLAQSDWDPTDTDAIDFIAQSNDPRLGWIIMDMLQFAWRPEFGAALIDAALPILDIELQSIRHRAEINDYLLAWDMPTFPGYFDHKRRIYTHYNDGWDRIFQDGDIKWEMVAWGGVDIDDRPYDTTDDFCSCIPAIDNPEVSSAKEATWIDDDDIVFGITVNGASRAYPRQIMEVREMVNDTLGGRDLGIPYCTLCGAAQAYFTDRLPNGVERPVLRTSGLLIRSNKVMYDVNTYSVFDTFLGKAVTGPLGDIGLELDQATVITTTWGEWKAAHPATTVLIEADALGRDFDLRNTRDANGPIFPVGDVDPRLHVHADVIGVITNSGTPVAFQRSLAMAALQSGEEVGFENVRLELAAGGLRAVDVDGSDLGSHQAFWFAWSQFHPTTVLWAG